MGGPVGARYLVTGGAGFIGSNFIRHLLGCERDARVTNLDALTYAGVRVTVEELDRDRRHTFVHGDIRDSVLLDHVLPGHDVVVHFAAESHVDRSILGIEDFLDTNVRGTITLLRAAQRAAIPRFIHVSTDEVYGSLRAGSAREDDPLRPSSPYSASKAASDLFVRSFGVTHGYDAIVTRCTNNYGPYQFPEKLIPLFVTNLLLGRRVPLYGDGGNQRDWLFVDDHCAAIHLLIERGVAGQIYNIGGNAPVSNLEVTRRVLAGLDRDESAIEYVADRPGHDRRYSVDSSKLRALGWQSSRSFADGLDETIQWYRARPDWWLPLKDRASLSPQASELVV
jgi:dTDP-glucose 4,6-dehydratase